MRSMWVSVIVIIRKRIPDLNPIFGYFDQEFFTDRLLFRISIIYSN